MCHVCSFKNMIKIVYKFLSEKYIYLFTMIREKKKKKGRSGLLHNGCTKVIHCIGLEGFR